MVEPQKIQASADTGVRIREIEERQRSTQERLLLLGKNVVFMKDETAKDIHILKKENEDIKRQLTQMQRRVDAMTVLTERFVKRDEMLLLERMLKDFQPLEFMRRKDVEELIAARRHHE